MYSDYLIDRVLLSPAREQGYHTLCIVSGWADARLLSTHLDEWLVEHRVHIRLLVGMFPEKDYQGRERDPDRLGIYWINFRALRSLCSYVGAYGSTFECRYVVHPPQLHTKLYLWIDEDGQAARAFVGSPNYTQKAFNGSRQGEVVTSDGDCRGCYDYFLRQWGQALPCTDAGIEDTLYQLRNRQ